MELSDIKINQQVVTKHDYYRSIYTVQAIHEEDVPYTYGRFKDSYILMKQKGRVDLLSEHDELCTNINPDYLEPVTMEDILGPGSIDAWVKSLKK